MQTGKINGNAVPRPTGDPKRDVVMLQRYLFEAMEELRFALAELDARTAQKKKKGE